MSRRVISILALCAALFGSMPAFCQSAQELFEKGKAAVKAGNSSEAIAAYEQAIALVRKNEPGSELHTKVSNNLGLVYMNAGQSEKALLMLEEALPLIEKRVGKLDIWYGQIAANIGMLYGAAREPQKVVFYFKDALPAFEKKYGLTSRELLPIRFQLASVSSSLRDYNTSVKYYKEILKYQNLPDSDRVFVIGGLAGDYYQMQEFDSAITLFNQRLTIEEKVYTRKHTEFIQTLNDLGAAYFESGRFGKAEQCYLEAYNTGKEILKPNDRTMARVLNNLGNINLRLKRYEGALNYYKRSLEIKGVIYSRDDPNYLLTLSNIAVVHSLMGNSAEALPIQESIYSIKKKTLKPDHPDMISASINIANSLKELGRFKDSETVCHEMLAIKPNIPQALALLAEIYQIQGRTKEEEVVRIKATQSARTTSPQNYGATVMELAKYYERQKDTKTATTYFLQAIDLTLKELSNNFAYQTEQEKLLYLKDMMTDENDFVALAFKQNLPAMTGKAYDFAASMKGIVMNSTVATRNWIMTHGTQEQKDSYKYWQNINAHLASWSLHITYETGKSIYGANQIQRLANRMEKKLIESVGENALKLPSKSWKAIAETLGQKEAMVEIFRTETDSTGANYFAVFITRAMTDHPEVIAIPNGRDLEKKYLTYYRNAIDGRIEDLVSYEQFWQPIQNKLTELAVTKVYFSPAGVYHQINLNTLFNPSTHAFLLNELDITYITSGFDLVEAGNPSQSKTALLIGSPLFSNTGKVAGTREYFEAIPGTQSEVVAIGSLMKKKGWKETELTGAAATESAIKNPVVKPGVLHIATHGFFIGDEYSKKLDALTKTSGGDDYMLGSDRMIKQNDRMMRSGLVLTGASDFLNGKTEAVDIKHDDGLLTAFEVSGLSLENTQLVVLSACKTGLGDVDASEGVFGLQRAFKLAGAKNLIMSLWSVSDEATANLMTAFYQEWLSTGDLATSFKSAQKKMVVKYQQPYYWGAFVLVGK